MRSAQDPSLRLEEAASLRMTPSEVQEERNCAHSRNPAPFAFAQGKLRPGLHRPSPLCYSSLRMATQPQNPPEPGPLYCPTCAQEVTDPLTCGDCSAVICRRCGTPLENPDELGIG
jgi:hypothetical protein